MNATASPSASEPEVGAAGAIWFLLLGIILILCGLFALLAPLASTLAISLILGAATAVAGVAQIIHAFSVRSWGGFFLNLLVGVVYAVCGVLLLFNPAIGALVLTMIVTIFLIVVGASEILLALRVRPERGWVWLMLSGLIALLGGLWLIFRLPVAGLFVPGLALGFSLIAEGSAFAVFGVTRGRAAKSSAGPAEPAAGAPV